MGGQESNERRTLTGKSASKKSERDAEGTHQAFSNPLPMTFVAWNLRTGWPKRESASQYHEQMIGTHDARHERDTQQCSLAKQLSLSSTSSHATKLMFMMIRMGGRERRTTPGVRKRRYAKQTCSCERNKGSHRQQITDIAKVQTIIVIESRRAGDERRAKGLHGRYE